MTVGHLVRFLLAVQASHFRCGTNLKNSLVSSKYSARVFVGV